MNIQIDTREKARAITRILYTFGVKNVKYYSSKLFVGDYMSLDNPRLIVDRKQSLNELVGNLTTGKKQFIDEFKRAHDNGIKLIILCEHGNDIKSIDHVSSWINPRLVTSPHTMGGEQLHKEMLLLIAKYGAEFVFCNKSQTGEKIIELLGNK